MFPSPKEYPYRLGLFLIAYYVTNSAFQNSMSLYYTAQGFTPGQVGLIFACIALVSIVAQPVWGTVADRSSSKNRVLRILAMCSVAAMLCILLADSFVPTLLLSCLFSVFYTSVQPMGDAIVLENLRLRGNKPFGPIRLMACYSFAVSSMLLGLFLTQGHEIRVIFCTAGLCTVTFASTWCLPHTPGGRSAGGKKLSFGTLLRNKELMLLMVFAMLLQITMGYFYTFFSPHFVSLPGGQQLSAWLVLFPFRRFGNGLFAQ